MTNDLQDRLDRLAGHAPGRVGGDLWERGTRRSRQRRTAVAGGLAAVVALLAVLVPVLRPDDARIEPAEPSFRELHLPRNVWAPAPDAPGTDETGPPGVVAVLGQGVRESGGGWFSEPRQHLGLFVVSAVTGESPWLDGRGAGSGDPFSVALSPDGTKVAWQRSFGDEEGGFASEDDVRGWAVYDTTTGRTRVLDPKIDSAGYWFEAEPQFSGDSRWLLTSYSPQGTHGSRNHALVAWDVETGRREVLEPPGRHWLPNVGSAADEFVWARGNQVFLQRAGEVGPRKVTVDHDTVVDVQVLTDGGMVYVAYDGRPNGKPTNWRAYVVDADGTERMLEDVDVGRVVGLRGGRVAVLDDHGPERRLVDVATGDRVATEEIRSHGEGGSLVLAADLWENPLVDGVRPPRPDSATLALVTGSAAAVTLLGGLLWRRRRGRA